MVPQAFGPAPAAAAGPHPPPMFSPTTFTTTTTSATRIADEVMIEVPAVQDLRDISLSAGGLAAAPSLEPPSSETQHPAQLEQGVQQFSTAGTPATLRQGDQQQQERRLQQTAPPLATVEQPADAAQPEPGAAAAGQAAGPGSATAAARADEGEAAAVEPGAGSGEAAALQPSSAEGSAAADGAGAAVGSIAADGAAGDEGTAGAASEPVEEEDELAASLLSNMSAWQSELDAFQAALRRCMETPAAPAVPLPASPAVGESGGAAARLQHNGPKGITGFRGVTQHKCVQGMLGPAGAAPLQRGWGSGAPPPRCPAAGSFRARNA